MNLTINTTTSKEEGNLWSSLLKESSKRTQNTTATCILVGDPNSGLNEIIDRITSNEIPEKTSAVGKDILTYNYFDIEEGLLETATRVHLWSFSQTLFGESLDLIGQSNKSDKVLFIIGVDLSKPDLTVSSLHIWLLKVAAYIKEYSKGLSKETVKQLKTTFGAYLKSARIHKGQTQTESNGPQDDSEDLSSSDLDFAIENYFFPMIVLGCNSNSVIVDDNQSLKKAKELQASLRSWTLDVGAALVYASSAKGINCDLLKRYIMHRLYPESIPLDLSIEDSTDRVFIPSGFDAEDLISISTGCQVNGHEFKSKFDPNSLELRVSHDMTSSTNGKTVESVAPSEPHLDVENEQDWLTSLHSFIAQVAASGGGPTGSTAESRGPRLSLAPEDNGLASSISHSSSVLNLAATSVHDGEDKLSNSTQPPLSTASSTRPRRTTASNNRSTGGASDKKDVGDFFKNLLEKK